MARVDWGNKTNLNADDLVKSFDDWNGEKITKQDIAKSFLQGALFKGPQFSTELETEAVARDISCRTLDRAKESLGIESAHVKNDDGANVWVSYFPQHEGKIKNFWRPGVLPQNSDPEVINKLDKLLELNEKLVNGLGVQGVGVQAPLMTQDANLSPRYETIENGVKPVSVSAAEIKEEELNQFYRAVNVLKNAGEWERKSWRAWANEWLYSNAVRGDAVVN